MKRDLSPPWVLFSERGQPVAILPAGRPGEVASVRGVSRKTANAIVRAANQPIRDAQVEMAKLYRQLLKLTEGIAEKDKP